MGRYQDALAAGEEALTRYRALAADNPAAYQGDLAGVLDSLSNRLSAVGRYPEALASIEEALALYRALAADNLAYQDDLARVLSNLSTQLDWQDRHDEAMAARAESVGIYSELASEDPDMYQERYRRALSSLPREYDQRGMQHEAVVHDLAEPPSTP